MTVPRNSNTDIQVHLFDNDLSSPSFITNLTDRVQGLRYSTKIPGGYGECRFRLATTAAEAWVWHTERRLYRLTIEDGTKCVFEGRLEDDIIDLVSGVTTLTFYGYYSNLTDVATQTTFNQLWTTTLTDILTANCLQISSDQSNITATDITVKLEAGEHTVNNYPIHVFNHLIAFGDTSDNHYDFAIWEDRIPFLRIRSVTSVDWFVEIKDFKRFALERHLRDMWNSAYAIYGAADTQTGTSTDADSIARFNLTRHFAVQTVGAGAAMAAAEAARDTWLAEHKDLFSETHRTMLGPTVTDSNGILFSSSWVRAGDVIRVRDLVPPSSALDSVSRDQERTYFIIETTYDATERTNTLILDNLPRGLMSLIVRHLDLVNE